MREIIIKDEQGKRIIALVEDTKLVELYEDDLLKKSLEGNIYCGIVRNILPGMQSAFVDINERKNAFLHIRDTIPKVSNETGNKCEKMSDYNINDYVKAKMPILVQVKKEEENQKGAKISTSINLPGRFIIIIPNTSFITVSQKITSAKEQSRLKRVVAEIVKEKRIEDYGIILRTSAENASKEELESDIESVVEVWSNIIKKFKKEQAAEKPVKLYNSPDTMKKTIIATAKKEEFNIIVNNKEVAEEVKKILKEINLEEIPIKIKEDNVFELYDLDTQIEKSKERKIWLKSGGFITLDKTEALTAIDVNSGKFVGKKNNTKDETVYKVNKEATVEIAKQLRLKNISGIIIIDYIDMEENEERTELIKMLESELKKDRSKTQIMGFTKLDLLEMTRKKI